MEIEKSMKSKELNDLFDYGYSIYQSDDYFKFSIDSVLLAEFVSLKKGQKKVIDLCSGNAPVPMILYKKFGNSLEITGVELQDDIYELGMDSLVYNNLTNINFINDDIKNVVYKYKHEKFDVVTCNPPYFKVNETNFVNDNEIKAIARHEIRITLEEVIDVASKIINTQGYFYMVHRPERLADVINLLNKYNFGVKRVQVVYDDFDKNSCLFLIESIFCGKDYVIINPPLFLKEYNTYQNIFKR